MKKFMLMAIMAIVAIAASAKDIKTVVFTTNPIMHCESCENKIKGYLRFEKGIKSIETNVEAQRVTVSYDAQKTNAEKLRTAFQKFGYEATIVESDNAQTKECCKQTKEASCCQQSKKEGCCKE